ERSAGGETARGGGLRDGRAVERRLSSCAVYCSAEWGRREGLLYRFWNDSKAGEGTDEDLCAGWDVFPLSRTKSRKAGNGPLAASVSRVYPEPRPGGKPRGWRQDRPGGGDGPRGGGGRPWAAASVFSLDFS